MNKQDFYRQEYRRLKPSWEDSLTIYRGLIDKLTAAETKILDIGCGHGELLKSVYERTPHTYGLDSDAEALAKNTIIRNKVVGRAESLPFDGNFFDVVVSEWVLEHLEDPEKTFREIFRVLKPGGKVIFLTPNVWNYNVWLIRMIPNSFHHFFTKRLYGRQEGDTYPVRYRINSRKNIAKILEPIGYKKSQLIFNGDPSYISFNRPLFALARMLEKILDFGLFNSAKVHIIGVYEK